MHNPQPDEQIEAIVAAFFLPPTETDLEYQLTLDRVQEALNA